MWNRRSLAAIGLALSSGILLACLAGTLACARKPAAATPAAQKWTCAMHPQVASDRPGKCPICGMDLIPRAFAGPGPEPRVPSPAPRVLYWYDPMKPEVHFDHPGKSPFMDMELVAKYAEEAPPAKAGAPPDLSVVRIPLERRQEIGVTTARVERRRISRRRRDQRRRRRRRGPCPGRQREVLRIHREAVRGPDGPERAPRRAAPLGLQPRPGRDRAGAAARR